MALGFLSFVVFVQSCSKENLIENFDQHNYDFPETATEYAALIEPDLGIVPTIDVEAMIEIPLYKDGVQVYGVFDVNEIDNPTRLDTEHTISGSLIQRYEGKTADGTALPDVIWIAFLRLEGDINSTFNSGIQIIGYNQLTGATAFIEIGDDYGPDLSRWVTYDSVTGKLTGVMPTPDDPVEFNTAFSPPRGDQCVSCHQADAFITDPFINAAKIPGTNESVVPRLGANAPYYVLGTDNWDMRTIHIEGNACLSCHRVGLNTIQLFESNFYDVNEHMPPDNPGSLSDDYAALMKAWIDGVENTPNASWVIPATGAPGPNQVVGDDYPYKSCYNVYNCDE